MHICTVSTVSYKIRYTESEERRMSDLMLTFIPFKIVGQELEPEPHQNFCMELEPHKNDTTLQHRVEQNSF
jgi:hypothetical protein